MSNDRTITISDREFDKMVKLFMCLSRKYIDIIERDSGVADSDTPEQRYFKISEFFDKLYNEECKKYPKMWYEHGLFGGEIK